jgi:hypothetical protein
MPRVSLYWPNAPIQAGTEVAVAVYHFGFYSLNATRVVYVVDETRPIQRFGFALGTLVVLASSAIYNPGAGTWTTASSLKNARVDHTSTLLVNGKVLDAGRDNANNELSSAELFTP